MEKNVRIPRQAVAQRVVANTVGQPTSGRSARRPHRHSGIVDARVAPGDDTGAEPGACNPGSSMTPKRCERKRPLATQVSSLEFTKIRPISDVRLKPARLE